MKQQQCPICGDLLQYLPGHGQWLCKKCNQAFHTAPLKIESKKKTVEKLGSACGELLYSPRNGCRFYNHPQPRVKKAHEV